MEVTPGESQSQQDDGAHVRLSMYTINNLIYLTYIMAVTLDDFVEEGRSVLDRFRENLEQVAIVVIVNQNVECLNRIGIGGEN